VVDDVPETGEIEFFCECDAVHGRSESSLYIIVGKEIFKIN
jgi:hypothetical protein